MSEGDLLEPGQFIRPNVSEDLAKQLVQLHYGYQVSRIKELNSYDDNNFYVEAKDAKGDTNKYILKVLNYNDSKKTGHVEAENAAMMFLGDNGFHCPIPQKNLQGVTFELVDIPAKGDTPASRNVIRLLSFVEGKIMYEVTPTPKLLYQSGEYIAQIDNTLKKYNHPALAGHTSNWLMANTLELRKFVYVIKDNKERYNMVMDVLNAFENRVIPSYPHLEKGVIHGDYNEQNIIVRPAKGNEGETEYNIHGVIDFGDLQNSYFVFELAVTLCYMMLECNRVGNIDALVGGGHVLAGYNKHRQVPQNELDLLRILVASRLCQSVVMGVYTYSLNPGNEYLLTTAKTGWIFLDKIWNETSDEKLLSIWKEVVDSL